jgi:predicted signal transduction protein with EAL and GGDEF domain
VLEVEASIGIAVFPDHGSDGDTLLRRADLAMYVAKESHAGATLYDAVHDHYSPARLTLVAASGGRCNGAS